MAKEKVPAYKKSLFSWLFEANRGLQILLLVVVAVTVFARLLPLEMQKKIVNHAIGMKNLQALWVYCGIYLAAVLVASGLKYVINVLQVVIGQRALNNMRKGLYHHLLTLPLSFYRRTQPGMVVSAIITELATAGDFLGMAVAIPITNIATLVVFAVYLFTLNWMLAVVTLVAYPVVLVVVPRLQRATNKWNKKRVDTTRQLSSLIGESISGIQEIQGNSSFALENRRFDKLADRILKIRIKWNLYRNGVKVLNNFINNLSPFLIFILGGYLSITGRLDLGALVAFLGAQEKLMDPWKELMDFYQAHQEAHVTYYRTMEYFTAEAEHPIAPADRKPYELTGDIAVSNVGFTTDTGIILLRDVSVTLKPGEHMALVGFSGSGKSTLGMCVTQLYSYTSGRLSLGGREVAELTKQDIANNIGLVSQSPFIFTGTIKENLLYAYIARMGKEEPGPEDPMPTLDDMIQVLQQTGIFVDVLRFGLNAILSRSKDADLAEKIVVAREKFRKEYGEELGDLVEFFREDQYLLHSSVLENLTFGTAEDSKFAEHAIVGNDFFLEFLESGGLMAPLLSLGGLLCTRTVDILGNLPPDAVFFEQAPFTVEELESYKAIAEKLKKDKVSELPDTDRQALLTLGLRFTPGRHKMVSLSESFRSLVLTGRKHFMEAVSREHPGAFSFYRMNEYIFSQTILNNILFGKVTTQRPEATDKINQSIIALLVAEDYLETIVEIGMEFNVGSTGDRLSGGQRQKLAIARAFLKAPRVLVMDEATSALDNKSQTRIQKLLETRFKGKTTLISVVHRLDIIKNFDKVAVMKAGKIVEMGPYDELIAKKGMLYELVHGKK
ncbi:MAG: ABC transporter ATP-binding protein/permease [Thermodesulfobacteriota bacterium]